MFLRDSSPVMEKLAERFPHLLELILSRLDDPTLENSRLVSKSWRNFVDWFWLVKQLRIYKTKTLGNKSLILLHEDWRKFFLHLESDLEALRLTVPLMKQYYQCNKSSTKEYTPLHYAVKKGHLAIVSYFKSETINLQTTDKHGRTLLHIACLSERNQQEIVKLLVDEIDVNQPDDLGNTPMHVACNAGHAELVTFLKSDTNIDENVANQDGCTPLHYACKNGHIEIVNSLLDSQSINMNATNENGWTPLHLACMIGLPEVVKLLLLQSSIDVDIKDSKGRTPLMLAKQNGHFHIVKQFNKGTSSILL